jgi:TolA-binding protein
MSIVDLHPEELLDKHARGALSETERARLATHVATCSVCRFELAVRVDLELDVQASRALAERPSVPPELAALPGPDVAVSPPALQPVRARSRRRAWVLGLAAALVGGMSFAALSFELAAPKHDAPVSATSRARRESGSEVATTVATSAPTSPSQQAVAPNSALQVASARAEEGDRVTAKGVRTARGLGMSAPELFRAANGARRSNDTERAIALYRELETRYPRSEESRVSYATLGSLLLDRGDARSALDGFNQYLARGDSALGEEALVGRALAFQRLGARDGETAAWQEVLRRFPASVHARVAKARLLELASH